MIYGYFGVPRCGKNTIATMIAQRELKRIERGVSKYKHVYTDFYCEGCERLNWEDFGKYKIVRSLIIFEEMSLDADNRNFKKFSEKHRDALVLHAHFFNDIIYLTQSYENVDKKIRDLTHELWYIEKSCVPLLRDFSFARRIFRTITINQHTSELIMGYRFASLLERLFTRCTLICYRPLYYKYFDSFDQGSLKDLPTYEGTNW